jgi:hypothetical protein
MSGLTVFFQGFLPDEHVATYQQSVTTLCTTAEQEGTNAPTPNVNIEFTEPLSFKEWRSLQKEVVNDYLQDRMLVPAALGGAAEGGDQASAANDPASGAEDSQSQFETQQFQEGSDDEGTAGPPLYRTPHMDEALHTVEFLTDIDLHTKEANLKLLEVNRRWFLRKTNRNAAMFVVPRRQPKYSTGLGPPRLPLYPCEDDGPLACLYRSVLSVEVTQIDRPSSSNRVRAAAAMHQETSVRRMKLFFYDGYATSVSRALAKAKESSTKLLLQLKKIPARCIVPQSMVSWVDYDTSHCCICLGDDSKMRMVEGEESTMVRFDSNETEVYVAFVNDDAVLEEYKILPAKCDELEVVPMEDAVIGPIIEAQKIQAPAIAGNSAGASTTTGLSLLPPPQTRPESPREATTNHLLDKPAAGPMDLDTIGEDQSALKPAAQSEELTGEHIPETLEEKGATGGIEMEGSEGMSIDPKQVENAETLLSSAIEEEELATVKDPSIEKPAPEDELETTRPSVSDGPTEENVSTASHTNQDGSQSHHPDAESTVQPPAQTSEGSAFRDSANASDTENDASQPSTTEASAPATLPVPPVNVDRALATAAGATIPIRIIQDDSEVREHARKRKRATGESTTEYHTMVRILPLLEIPMIAYVCPSHTLHPQSNLRRVYDSHKAVAKQPGVKAGECCVNVFGVVLGFGCHKKTSRGQWMISVALVDESLRVAGVTSDEDFLTTVNINIFSKQESGLPKLRYAGDILRLHRVVIGEWKNEIQLRGAAASSYVVCRRAVTDDGDGTLDLIPTSKSFFDPSDTDKQKFNNIWKWGQLRLEKRRTMMPSKTFKLMDMCRQDSDQIDLYSDETADKHKDLCVMITGKISCGFGSTLHPAGFLRVWDGTGFPHSDPLPDIGSQAFECIVDGDPPPEALKRLADLIKRLRDRIPWARTLVQPTAVTGRVVNVAVWEPAHWKLCCEVLSVGSFVRLRNIMDEPLPGGSLRCLKLTSMSYMTPLPDMTYEIAQLIKEHHERLERHEQLNPMSGILPLPTGGGDTMDSSMPPSPSHLRQSPALEAGKQVETDGLVSLIHDRVPKNLSAFVNIVGTVPPFPVLAGGDIERIISGKLNFGVRLEDDDLNQVDAAVTGGSEVAAAILGSSSFASLKADEAIAFLRAAIKRRWKWVADMQSVSLDGGKFYVVDEIRRRKGEL